MLIKQINKRILKLFKGKNVLIDIKLYTSHLNDLDSVNISNERIDNIVIKLSTNADVKAVVFQEVLSKKDGFEIKVEVI